MKPYQLIYTDEARTRIRHLHPEIKGLFREVLSGLRENPWLGKPLQRELFGYYSLRIKQYRVIYQVDETHHRCTILTCGPRRTIYEDFVPQVEK